MSSIGNFRARQNLSNENLDVADKFGLVGPIAEQAQHKYVNTFAHSLSSSDAS